MFDQSISNPRPRSVPKLIDPTPRYYQEPSAIDLDKIEFEVISRCSSQIGFSPVNNAENQEGSDQSADRVPGLSSGPANNARKEEPKDENKSEENSGFWKALQVILNSNDVEKEVPPPPRENNAEATRESGEAPSESEEPHKKKPSLESEGEPVAKAEAATEAKPAAKPEAEAPAESALDKVESSPARRSRMNPRGIAQTSGNSSECEPTPPKARRQSTRISKVEEAKSKLPAPSSHVPNPSLTIRHAGITAEPSAKATPSPRRNAAKKVNMKQALAEQAEPAALIDVGEEEKPKRRKKAAKAVPEAPRKESRRVYEYDQDENDYVGFYNGEDEPDYYRSSRYDHYDDEVSDDEDDDY